MRTITLSGELDIYALAEVERAFAGVSDGDVAIDMRQVRSVSASFFGALARLRKRLPGSRIEIVGANRNVRRVFEIVQADALVRVS